MPCEHLLLGLNTSHVQLEQHKDISLNVLTDLKDQFLMVIHEENIIRMGKLSKGSKIRAHFLSETGDNILLLQRAFFTDERP